MRHDNDDNDSKDPRQLALKLLNNETQDNFLIARGYLFL
jgi:hypothetical protein